MKISLHVVFGVSEKAGGQLPPRGDHIPAQKIINEGRVGLNHGSCPFFYLARIAKLDYQYPYRFRSFPERPRLIWLIFKTLTIGFKGKQIHGPMGLRIFS